MLMNCHCTLCKYILLAHDIVSVTFDTFIKYLCYVNLYTTMISKSACLCWKSLYLHNAENELMYAIGMGNSLEYADELSL